MHMVCVSGVLRGTASRYVAREAVRGAQALPFICHGGANAGLQKQSDWAGISRFAPS